MEEAGEDIPYEEAVSDRNTIMTYLLNAASKKLPIKERDCAKSTGIKTANFKRSFEMATSSLKETFGICVMDVPNSKIGKCYICCNKSEAGTSALYDSKQKRELTLLFIILSYIFMRATPSSEGTTEEELKGFLNTLGIDFLATHEYFGANIQKLVTDTFVRQLYLKREKSSDENSTETVFVYSWGYRAQLEFDKKKVLEACCKIMQKSIQTFAHKYQEVFGSEQQQE